MSERMDSLDHDAVRDFYDRVYYGGRSGASGGARASPAVGKPLPAVEREKNFGRCVRRRHRGCARLPRSALSRRESISLEWPWMFAGMRCPMRSFIAGRRKNCPSPTDSSILFPVSARSSIFLIPPELYERWFE